MQNLKTVLVVSGCWVTVLGIMRYSGATLSRDSTPAQFQVPSQHTDYVCPVSTAAVNMQLVQTLPGWVHDGECAASGAPDRMRHRSSATLRPAAWMAGVFVVVVVVIGTPGSGSECWCCESYRRWPLLLITGSSGSGHLQW
jgi:hypothetical protein